MAQEPKNGAKLLPQNGCPKMGQKVIGSHIVPLRKTALKK
jgi:hypothetical protein